MTVGRLGTTWVHVDTSRRGWPDPAGQARQVASALPAWRTTSRPARWHVIPEADLAFLDDPDRQKADLVEGAIGELSVLHQREGVYAEGIHVSTAILPDGWHDRLLSWPVQASHPAQPLFLEPHDLCVAKLFAGREKDHTFVAALIDARMVRPDIIRERLGAVPADTHPLAIERALNFMRPR